MPGAEPLTMRNIAAHSSIARAISNSPKVHMTRELESKRRTESLCIFSALLLGFMHFMRNFLISIGVLLAGTFELPAPPLPPVSEPVSVPALLSYQGLVKVGDVPFTGIGQFKFAIINTSGTTNFWSNSPFSGAKPISAVSLPVTNGLFTVQLGDTNLGMIALSPNIFTNGSLALRIWFDDGINGSSQLSPDQRLTSSGYAMLAGSVADRGVSGESIASSSITSDKLAPSDAFEVDAVGNIFAKRVFDKWGTNTPVSVDLSIPGYTNSSSGLLLNPIDWAVPYEKTRENGTDQIATGASHFRRLQFSRTAFAERMEWRKWYLDVLNDRPSAKTDVVVKLLDNTATVLRTVTLDNAFPVRWSLTSEGGAFTEEITLTYEAITIQ